jgi:hypothetical protein
MGADLYLLREKLLKKRKNLENLLEQTKENSEQHTDNDATIHKESLALGIDIQQITKVLSELT